MICGNSLGSNPMSNDVQIEWNFDEGLDRDSTWAENSIHFDSFLWLSTADPAESNE